MTSSHLALPTAEALDVAPNPVAVVLGACERATMLLGLALVHGNLDDIVEIKSQAELIRAYTQQKHLGHMAEMAATELVRRAERGLGKAVRRGQETGEIRSVNDVRYRKDRQVASSVHEGNAAGVHQVNTEKPKRSPREFFGGGKDYADIYALTDGVTDEQFDGAISEAKDEGNLSRANVVRKVKRCKPPSSRPEQLRNMRHLDPNRIVQRAIGDSGLDSDLAAEIDYRALDRDRLEEWISSLNDVIKSLSTLRRNLKKELNRE